MQQRHIPERWRGHHQREICPLSRPFFLPAKGPTTSVLHPIHCQLVKLHRSCKSLTLCLVGRRPDLPCAHRPGPPPHAPSSAACAGPQSLCQALQDRLCDRHAPAQGSTVMQQDTVGADGKAVAPICTAATQRRDRSRRGSRGRRIIASIMI